MFFLLRVAFWLGVVLILLPSGFLQPSDPTSDVGAADAISAASATVEDLRGFCTRQPDACSVGSHMATAIGYKAQAGAKMLYDVLTEALAPHDTGALTRGAGNAGDAKSTQAKSAPQTSQNTLTPADLVPAWRGPQRKDGKQRGIARSLAVISMPIRQSQAACPRPIVQSCAMVPSGQAPARV